MGAPVHNPEGSRCVHFRFVSRHLTALQETQPSSARKGNVEVHFAYEIAAQLLQQRDQTPTLSPKQIAAETPYPPATAGDFAIRTSRDAIIGGKTESSIFTVGGGAQ
ncbi:hypothetical protein CcaCcLH18_10215 [Colletotrichum camelliae]|nr:hypothetical protein CcaCcLH18_10215 [Colletotrichum camelliae]